MRLKDFYTYDYPMKAGWDLPARQIIKLHSIMASTPDCLSENAGSIPVGAAFENEV